MYLLLGFFGSLFHLGRPLTACTYRLYQIGITLITTVCALVIRVCFDQ